MNLSEEYYSEIFGSLGTDTFRIFFKKTLPNVANSESAKVYISPFHDVPLHSELGSNVYRMIVTMPRWSNEKMEISKCEPFNPIKHVSVKNVLKYIENIYPFHGVIWNYGSFPQTWEMPSYQNPDFEGFKGNSSLIDVIEIGSKIQPIGTVLDVKVLGAIVLLSKDYLDWKIVAININDPLASRIEEINDIEDYMPGLLEYTMEWFRFSKVPIGEPPLNFGYNKFVNKTVAYETIYTSHKFWKNLIKNELLFKHSRDSAEFKLFNTQCIDCNTENFKNGHEAESIIENLKQLIVNRPIESMAHAPSDIQKEQIYYLNKKEILSKLLQKKDSKKSENEEKTTNIFEFLTENFSTIIIPISIFAIMAPLIYLRLR